MSTNLRDLTRAFGRGEATLESLRGAARAERDDRQLADEVLTLITHWENSPVKDTARARDDLRVRAKKLVPPDPPAATVSKSRREPAKSIYEAGLRGQRRRS